VAAFARAFSKAGGGHLVKAKWDVRPSGNGAVAAYRGRAGLIKGITIMSSTATAEEQAAMDSEVTFKVEEVTDGTATCAMWLSSKSTSLGFTSDGRFFRPYMRSVEDQLRQIDPRIAVSKA
jgi:hypothetical protein